MAVQTKKNPLIGLHFISYNNKKELEYQGMIVGIIGEYVLVDIFSWFSGHYSCSKVIPMSDIYKKNWDLYYSQADWVSEATRKRNNRKE